MKNLIIILNLCLVCYSCNKHHHKEHHEETHSEEHNHHDSHEPTTKISVAELKNTLTNKGYKIFDYVDEKSKDTILMQEYYIAFLKRGPNRSQSKSEADSLQKLHMAHLGKMYENGYADISGPFGDDGDIRGITIYNVPSQEFADSLANMDPMVKAGRLVIEIHPWWAAKGFPLC